MMKKQNRFKSTLYLEYEPDQIFYINGFKRDVILPYLLNPGTPKGFYGLWDNFELVYKKTTTIPETEKFFYPIIISLYQVTEIFDQISIGNDIISRVRSGQCKILVLCPFEGWEWGWWDKIGEILEKKFQISSEGIVFLSGNHYPNKKYKTVSYNVWELLLFQSYPSFDHYERNIAELGNHRPNKFICLNRRPATHRYAIVTELYDLRDQGILTCALEAGFKKGYVEWVEDHFLNDYPELAKKYLKKIKPILPLKFDDGIDPEVENPSANEWGKIEKYYSSYLHIVTETFFENRSNSGSDTLFLSEKIFKPIIFFQPFVVLARPGTLKLMRDLGYRTFSEYIDESYDTIENNKFRFYKAIESIKQFISMPDEKLTKLMIEMEPIFKHNYKLLKENFEYRAYNKLRSDLYSCLQES